MIPHEPHLSSSEHSWSLRLKVLDEDTSLYNFLLSDV